MKNDSNHYEDKPIDLRTDKHSDRGIHEIPPNNNGPHPYITPRERPRRSRSPFTILLFFIVACPIALAIMSSFAFSTTTSTNRVSVGMSYSDDESVYAVEMGSAPSYVYQYEYEPDVETSYDSDVILSEAFPIGDVKQLDINLTSTNVEFSKSESNKIVVTWYSNTSKEEHNVQVAFSENKLTISEDTENLLIEPSYSHIEISLPYIKLEDIKINTVHSNINFNNDVYTDQLHVDAVAGDIQMYNLNSSGVVFINSTSGNFSCGDVTAKHFSFNSVYGSFNSNAIICDELSVKTTNSQFNPTGVYSGNIYIETENGDVCIPTMVSDDVSIKTSSGTIQLSSPSSKNIKLNTVSGNVELSNPDFDSIEVETITGDFQVSNFENDQPFKLTADTVSGSINNNYGNADNSAERSISFKSVSGSLYIN